MSFIIFWLVVALLVAFVAREKGRSGIAWFLLAVVFSPLLALLALIAVPAKPRPKVLPPLVPGVYPRYPKALPQRYCGSIR